MEAIKFENNTLYLLDQRQLPEREVWLSIDSYAQAAEAIVNMSVRGAPAIGIAAAYAYCLAALEFSGGEDFEGRLEEAENRLLSTRPTAVNLFWAVNKMRQVVTENPRAENLPRLLIEAAREIHSEDIELCREIGRLGASLVPDGARILTHCNAGALATGGYGTALGIIRSAHSQGKVQMVYADETRPLLQGARLTCYELQKDGISVSLQPDSAAGYLMACKMIDLVIVGADRICRNGDFANKIGTYSLAVLAKHHGIPFYTAAPYSTIDPTLSDGGEIPIEHRGAEELLFFKGFACAPEGTAVFNPAFDVTPAELVSGIVTDRGVYRYPYNFTGEK